MNVEQGVCGVFQKPAIISPRATSDFLATTVNVDVCDGSLRSTHQC
jgi:hypothetical protein